MKLRLTLLALTLALLIVPVAVFAAPPAASVPAVCSAPTSAPASILDAVTLKVLSESLSLAKCGTCSDSICKGANVGSICGIGGGGQYKFCGDVGICSDTLTQCRCKTGPPF